MSFPNIWRWQCGQPSVWPFFPANRTKPSSEVPKTNCSRLLWQLRRCLRLPLLHLKKENNSSECLNVSSWLCFPIYHACQIEDISLGLCVVIYCRSDSTEEPSSRVKLPPRLSALTSFQGYTGELFVVCLFKGQLSSGDWIGEVIPHTFPGKDRCVYLDRPHPGLWVLDVDNFSRVGNMQELRQAITLPHQLPWRSNMDTLTVTHLLSSTDAYNIAS